MRSGLVTLPREYAEINAPSEVPADALGRIREPFSHPEWLFDDLLASLLGKLQ